jgi:hypothetical protein
MTYERCFPNVSQPKASQAAKLTFADWSESEAGQRIDKLLAQGWTVGQVARMFGLRAEEVERLSSLDISGVCE